MNQSCYALKAREGFGQIFLFFTTRGQVDTLSKSTGGATFDTIVVDTFRKLRIVKPPIPLASKFERVTEPLLSLILVLLGKNSLLRCSRDLLLPKLISGDLDVSDLDIKVPEEAA